MLASYKVRAVPVNVNFRYVDEELIYLFDNADLKAVFTEPDLEDRRVARRRHAVVVVPGRGRRRPLRSVARRPARHRARRRRPLARRPVRVVDRWYDRHAQGRDVAPGRHLHVGASAAAATRPSASRRWRTSTTWRRGPRTGTPLPGSLILCPLMHGGGFWVGFNAVLSGTYMVLIRDTRVRPRVRAAGGGRGARADPDDDRRRVRPADRRRARTQRARSVRPVVVARVRLGRRDPLAVGEAGPRARAADDRRARRLRRVRDRRPGPARRYRQRRRAALRHGSRQRRDRRRRHALPTGRRPDRHAREQRAHPARLLQGRGEDGERRSR